MLCKSRTVNFEVQHRCLICKRLLIVYCKNPHNHRKTLNWLLGVVYLHGGKKKNAGEMITGRMAHFICIELQFCLTITCAGERFKVCA